MGRWAIINGLLGVLVAGLVFGLVGTWTRRLPPIEASDPAPASDPGSPPPGKAPGKGKRGDKGGPKGDLSPQALVTNIVEHDLFDLSRAKPADDAKAVAVVPKETNPPPNTVLVGVSILGTERQAFMSESGTVKRLHVGDQIAGYTLKGVNSDGVDLASPSGDPVSMALNMEKKAVPATPPGVVKPAAVPAQPPRPGVASPAAGLMAPSPAAGVGGKPATPAVPPRGNMPPVPPPAGVAGAPPVAPPAAPGVQVGGAASPGGMQQPNAGPGRRGGIGRHNR